MVPNPRSLHPFSTMALSFSLHLGVPVFLLKAFQAPLILNSQSSCPTSPSLLPPQAPGHNSSLLAQQLAVCPVPILASSPNPCPTTPSSVSQSHQTPCTNLFLSSSPIPVPCAFKSHGFLLHNVWVPMGRIHHSEHRRDRLPDLSYGAQPHTGSQQLGTAALDSSMLNGEGA